jgi:hypothetical protein
VLSSDKVFDEFNVSLLSVFLGETLLGIPGVPFSLSFEVEHAWSGGVVITM